MKKNLISFVQDFELPKHAAELLGSGLKENNLLDIILFNLILLEIFYWNKKREPELLQDFKIENRDRKQCI